MTYNLGQAVQLNTSATDTGGTPEDVTIALSVTRQDGTTATLLSGPTRTDTGQYVATVVVDQVGTWFYRWDATGTILDNDRGQFAVGDPRPPMYASLAELKRRMNITNTASDDEIADALDAASRDVEADTGDRKFWLDATPSARTLNVRGRIVDTPEGQKLLVDDIGSTTGLLVEVGSGSTFAAFDSAGYQTGPDNSIVRGRPITYLLRYYTPWSYFPTQQVRITAQWGWPRIPPQIKQATLIRAQRIYRRRDTPEGVAGMGEMGVVRIGRYDPDYDKEISSFIEDGFGG